MVFFFPLLIFKSLKSLETLHKAENDVFMNLPDFLGNILDKKQYILSKD